MSRHRLDPSFWRFWSGSAVSQLGDGMRFTALPLLAATLTREPVSVAIVGGAVWLPWLVFGGIGGVIVDRVDRRRLMRDVQVGRGLVMAILVWLVFADLASIPILAVTAFVIGIGEVLVDGALYSVVPRVVSEEDLDAANGRLGAAELVANGLAGPPFGAFLFGVAPPLPLIADALSFGASAAVLGGIEGDFRPPRDESASTSVWQEAHEGFSWLWGHRVLRAITVGLGVMNVAAGGWAILVLYALEVLGVTGVAFGLLVMATAVGGVVGSFMGQGAARVLGRSRAMVMSLGLAGIGTAGIGLTSDAFVAWGCIFLEGLGIGIFNVVARSLRQILTPDRLLGRVTTGQRIFGYGMGAVGAVTGGLLAESVGLRSPFLIGGAVVIAIAALMGFWVNERTTAAELH